MLRRMCASKIEPVFTCQCRMCLLLDTLLQISNPLLFFTVFRPVLEANAFKTTGQCRLNLVSIWHRNSPYPLMVTATRCNTLQHTAIHCKTKHTTTPPYPLMMVVFWLNHSLRHSCHTAFGSHAHMLSNLLQCCEHPLPFEKQVNSRNPTLDALWTHCAGLCLLNRVCILLAHVQVSWAVGKTNVL